jgi:3-dehydroquinate synthase
MIKHALIADKNYWKDVRKTSFKSSADYVSLIHRSVQLKNTIVLKDPFEKNDRKKLNFGHTLGHAIESALLHSKTPLLHGEAIAIGMICESFLSHQVGSLTAEELQEIVHSICSIYPLKPIRVPYPKLYQLMHQDKKNSSRKINFTLLKKIGSASINHTCSSNLIKSSITYYNKLLSRH